MWFCGRKYTENKSFGLSSRSVKDDITYLLTAIGLTPGGSSTVHIYTQTVHRTTQLTTLVGRLSGIRTQTGQTNWEECGPCPIFAIFTLAFVLQLRKNHGKTSVRATEECQLAR